MSRWDKIDTVTVGPLTVVNKKRNESNDQENGTYYEGQVIRTSDGKVLVTTSGTDTVTKFGEHESGHRNLRAVLADHKYHAEADNIKSGDTEVFRILVPKKDAGGH